MNLHSGEKVNEHRYENSPIHGRSGINVERLIDELDTCCAGLLADRTEAPRVQINYWFTTSSWKRSPGIGCLLGRSVARRDSIPRISLRVAGHERHPGAHRLRKGRFAGHTRRTQRLPRARKDKGDFSVIRDGRRWSLNTAELIFHLPAAVL
jgi:hypothetical protein